MAYKNAIMIEERCAEGQTGFHVIDHWRYIAKLTLPEDLFDLGYQISSNNRDSVNQANTYFKADKILTWIFTLF